MNNNKDNKLILVIYEYMNQNKVNDKCYDFKKELKQYFRTLEMTTTDSLSMSE